MNEIVEPTDVAFAITADSGELATQADALIRSLRDQYQDAPILTFVPRSAISGISDDVRDRLHALTTVVTGDIPIPEYPISALVRAFVEAERRFDSRYLVALDTDTLVLDRLRLPAKGDVWLRPADVGSQYWTSKRSRNDWATLYGRFDLSVPIPFFQLTSSVDRRLIPPYWNSGVVVTTDRSLPERWLEYTEKFYYDDTLPVSPEEFFIDQISLSLAVRKNEVQNLTERENYPLGGRLIVPQNVAVVHYGDRRNLTRIVQPNIRAELCRFDAVPDVELSRLISSLLVVASTKSGVFLSYVWKRRVRSAVLSILPESIGESGF